MFSKEQINEYRHVHVPASLKQKIMSSVPDPALKPVYTVKRSRPLGLAAMAVFFVFIFTIPLLSVRVHVFYNDALVSEEPVSLPVPASHSNLRNHPLLLSVPLEIRETGIIGSQNIKISVSHGNIFYIDSSSGTLISAGSEYQAKNDLTLYWQIENPSPSAMYTILVLNGNRQQRLCLFFDDTSGWSLCQSKN